MKYFFGTFTVLYAILYMIVSLRIDYPVEKLHHVFQTGLQYATLTIVSMIWEKIK